MPKDQTSARLCFEQHNCALGTCSQTAETRSPAVGANIRGMGTQTREPTKSDAMTGTSHIVTFGQARRKRSLVAEKQDDKHTFQDGATLDHTRAQSGPKRAVIVGFRGQQRL